MLRPEKLPALASPQGERVSMATSIELFSEVSGLLSYHKGCHGASQCHSGRALMAGYNRSLNKQGIDSSLLAGVSLQC